MLLIVTPIVGFCNYFMYWCTLLYVHSSFADGEERAGCFDSLSSLCLLMVERLFLAVPGGCLRFVIVVFPDHTHLYSMELPGIMHLISLH